MSGGKSTKLITFHVSIYWMADIGKQQYQLYFLLSSYGFLPSYVYGWQRQTAVTAYFSRQTAVTAYYSSNQLLLFVFPRRSVFHYSMAEENPAAQSQTAVAAYFTSKQLLLFVFARRSVCQYSMAEENPAAQSQTAVTTHFSSNQLLLFVFPRRSVCQYSMAEENPAAGRQTTVTTHFSSKQLLLFVFARHRYYLLIKRESPREGWQYFFCFSPILYFWLSVLQTERDSLT